MKKVLFLIPLLVSCFASSCGNNKITVTTKVLKQTLPAFGNVNFEMTHDEFIKAGFNYDDLIEVTINDYDGAGHNISYEVAYVTNYNEVGYYAPCLCNYEGKSEHFDLAFGMSKVKDFSDRLIGKTATFTLKEKRGYEKVRNLVNVSKKLTYEELGRDNLAFANFRDVATVGKISEIIRPQVLYRGSSPYNPKDNPDGRHDVEDRLLDVFNINTEVALCGSDKQIEDFMIKREAEYPKSKTVELYKTHAAQFDSDKKFFSQDLGTDYFTIYNNNDLQEGGGDLTRKIFTYIASRCGGKESPAPIYLHCNEGKDRTGFFVMVLEALAGVSLEDIVDDFMLTFKNYYNVSRPNSKEKYDALANLTVYRHIYSILLDDPSNELEKVNWYHFDAKSEVEKMLVGRYNELQTKAENYLEKTINMDKTKIEILKSWLSQAN